jgi:hypothetical protein
MNWNLTWESIDTHNGKFTIYLGDEPVLTKRMYGQIYRTDKDTWITFVENSHKFSFEDCNEFIAQLENDTSGKITFDIWDGEEAIAYDSETQILTWALDSYTSNLHFSIPMDPRTRNQFAVQFRNFLNFYLNFYDSSTSTTELAHPVDPSS